MTVQVELIPMVSIHAPRGGSDAKLPKHPFSFLFQSTLPVGGATP